MVHLNAIRIIMAKDNDRKTLYLFPDGKVRDMTNGFGELYTFNELNQKLIKEGYKQVYNT